MRACGAFVIQNSISHLRNKRRESPQPYPLLICRADHQFVAGFIAAQLQAGRLADPVCPPPLRQPKCDKKKKTPTLRVED